MSAKRARSASPVDLVGLYDLSKPAWMQDDIKIREMAMARAEQASKECPELCGRTPDPRRFERKIRETLFSDNSAEPPNKDGRTVAHAAASANSVQTLAYLSLHTNANVRAKDSRGKTGAAAKRASPYAKPPNEAEADTGALEMHVGMRVRYILRNENGTVTYYIPGSKIVVVKLDGGTLCTVKTHYFVPI